MADMRVGSSLEPRGMDRARVLTVLATLGALWCLFLAPIQSGVWNADEPGPPPIAVTLMAAVIDVGGRVHQALGPALGPALGLTPYEFWGRLFVLVYLGAIAGVLIIRRRGPRGRLARTGSGLLLAGLVLALVGDVAAYWAHGTALEDLRWSRGFAVELTGLFLMLVGMLILGIGSLRARQHAVGALLLCGAVLAVPMTFVVRYIPHGTMLPIAAALAGASWLLIRRSTGSIVVTAEADVL